MKPRIVLRFIPTYHNRGELGHIRPKCCKSLIRNNKQDLTTHVRLLTNQVSHLTELATQLTKITSPSKKILIKKSEPQVKVMILMVGALVVLWGQKFKCIFFKNNIIL